MFKIVGQFSCEPNEERKFLVVDNQNGFTIQTLTVMRQLLGRMPENAFVEVGSLYNYNVDKVLARTCITKTGRLSYKGAAVVEIGEVSNVKVTKNSVVINGTDLGQAVYCCMYGWYAKDRENDEGVTYDMGVIYFPKLDLLHFLPFCGLGHEDESFGFNLKAMEEYVDSWIDTLCSCGVFFKLSGALREEHTVLRDFNVKSNNKLFLYGEVISIGKYSNLAILDSGIRGLPLSRLLTNLESMHIVGKFPCLLGHTTGKLSKKGERVRNKDMFGPSIIEAFRIPTNQSSSWVDYEYDPGLLEAVDGSNTYRYEVSFFDDNSGENSVGYFEPYEINAFSGEANDPWIYRGILGLNPKTKLPEVKITLNKCKTYPK